MTVDESGTTIDAATAVRGGAAGTGAFLLGYLFTFLSAADTGVRVAGAFQPLASAGGRFAPAWKVAGWLFLDGHVVGTRFDGRTVDVVSLAGVEFLYLVPPLLLVTAGALVAVISASTTRQQGWSTARPTPSATCFSSSRSRFSPSMETSARRSFVRSSSLASPVRSRSAASVASSPSSFEPTADRPRRVKNAGRNK